MKHGLSAEDSSQLAERGISPDEAERQLALLRAAPPAMALERACTLGDGLETLAPARAADLAARGQAAAAAGRASLFVPASGAATRMFRELQAARGRAALTLAAGLDAAAAAGDADARVLRAFLEAFDRFAFRDALCAVLAARGRDAGELRSRGPFEEVLSALLDPDGLDYGRLPKALLLFHREGDGARTPFEDHLSDAADLAGTPPRTARAHFTVPAGFEPQFQRLLAREISRRGNDTRFDVTFSEQSPATDTLAVDAAGEPLRDAAGRLVLRPSGHGALLWNLERCGGDLVFIRNIDNIAAASRRATAQQWALTLIGLLEETRERVARLLARLADPGDAGAPADAEEFLGDPGSTAAGPIAAGAGVTQARAAGSSAAGARPAGAAATDRAQLALWLSRPIRVCGMVPNTGEPGGGPFWVRDASGVLRRQIVESAQIAQSAEQRRIFESATHFNPVFLACALRDASGRPFVLDQFTDPAAAIVTRKSANGREIRALERPGLWNGAMSEWISVFVEVPGEVFCPVKIVLDLLRPEHQAG